VSVFRFWKPDVKRDIDDELRFHFDARIAELVSLGSTPEAARAQALAEFGDVDAVRSDLRAIDDRLARRRGRAEVFDGWRQDIWYAARSLRRAPGVSMTIILTLALGLGVNAAMFSLLDVVLFRTPAGVADPGAVRRVWSLRVFRSGAQYWSGYDYASYAAVEQSLAGRADLAIYEGPSKFALGRGETPPQANVVAASASLFRVLGVRPAHGRFYGGDEDRLEAGTSVAVISDRLWRRDFGAERGVIGTEIALAGRPYTIIGIAPPGFSGVDLNAADVWLPLASNPSYPGAPKTPWYENPGINAFQILLRLRPDAQATELEQRATLALRLPGIGFRQDTTTVARFGSIVKAQGPGKVSAAVQVAQRAGGVALIVLLVAFANVVNLLLARAVRRRREIAVRLALGISSSRLVRLLVTESVLLSLAAAVAAFGAAWWGGALLRKLLMPEITWAEDPLHWRVLLLGMTAAIVAGAAAGLVPALQSRSPDLTRALKTGVREGSARRSRLRGFLVASQAALSVLLIVGAALFVRSLRNVRGLDIGYSVDRLAFVSVQPGSDKATNADISSRLLQLEDRIANVPGVERVAYTSMRPKWGISFTEIIPESETAPGKHLSFYTAASPGFFAATGTRVIRGRTFASGAAGRVERGVLVNRTMVDSIWPGQDPIGRCIRFKTADAPCYSVIGVTQTALLIGLKDKPEPHVYVPLDNLPFETRGVVDIVLRMNPNRLPAALAQVRDMLRDEFPGEKVATNTMAAAMEPEYRPWQLGATLFTLFGALAALVAAIGVYSSVSYAVSQRTHEFGVRVALGASGGRIVGQVVADGVRTVAIGVVAGIALALALGRIVASLLYGVSPSDPLAILVAAAVLLGVAVAASFVPAWRAGRSDPVSALRTD
jgi:predicted permease